MQESDFFSEITFGDYFSEAPYQRFFSRINESDTDAEAGELVTVTKDGFERIPNGLAEGSAAIPGGVLTEDTASGKRGKIVYRGLVTVKAGDNSTGAQMVSTTGPEAVALEDDPRRYIGEALSYDSETDTKLVYVRLG